MKEKTKESSADDTFILEQMFACRDGILEAFSDKAAENGWTLEAHSTPKTLKSLKVRTSSKSLLTLWIRFEHHNDLELVEELAAEIREFAGPFGGDELAPLTFISPEPTEDMEIPPPLSGYSLQYLFQPQQSQAVSQKAK